MSPDARLLETSAAETTAHEDVVRSVHRAVVDLHAASPGALDSEVVRHHVRRLSPLLSDAQVETVTDQVSQRLFGLGPIDALLHDADVDEIMINGPGRVWIERRGTIEPTSVRMDAELLQVVVERILAPLGLRVDRLSPFVDARLDDGSRVNIAVPPLALDGPYVTIRRFRSRAFELSEFCGPEERALLVDAMQQRRSIVVSGGTGAGKTSLLNALCSHIDPTERVVTIEDAAELRLPGEHVVRLEARPANAEGHGAVPIRALVRNALRMRPDRLVIGEVRGGEAFDMIQAMNTGHQGSLSTCHANSPIDALRRLETMALMGDVDLPLAAVRDSLVSAVDLIVHLERVSGGHRLVHSVSDCRTLAASAWPSAGATPPQPSYVMSIRPSHP